MPKWEQWIDEDYEDDFELKDEYESVERIRRKPKKADDDSGEKKRRRKDKQEK